MARRGAENAEEFSCENLGGRNELQKLCANTIPAPSAPLRANIFHAHKNAISLTALGFLAYHKV